MTQDEAVALAEKRERHKSKHMTDKAWKAVHDSVKGWHVALVQTPQSLMLERVHAGDRMRRAVMTGDLEAFTEAASAAMLRRYIWRGPTHERG